jgi:outer membrane protein TolC
MLLCCAAGRVSAEQQASSLTLEACYQLAEEHYPLVRQQGLIQRTMEYSLENAARGYWPQLTLAGQATYQSDVTTLPISLPGVSIPQISKDQYKIYGELTETLYDNGLIRKQQELTRITAETETQRNAAELYKLHERVNQLFFGILMLDAQLSQSGLLMQDVQLGLDKVNGAIHNGTALRSSADILKAQLLQVQQRQIELRASRKAYADMLALFTGMPMDGVQLEAPQSPAINEEITRPELRIFELQKQGYQQQIKLLSARSMPKLGAFIQGGAGRPALNFLDNDFKPYYIGGLRLSWNISSFYTLRREKSLLRVSMENTDVQRDVFLFNTSLGMKQYNAEITKLQQLLTTDEEIIGLRASVKQSAAAQLSNGVSTSSDYLREVNNEDRAKQDLLLHRIQLLMAYYNYQTTTGY